MGCSCQMLEAAAPMPYHYDMEEWLASLRGRWNKKQSRLDPDVAAAG